MRKIRNFVAQLQHELYKKVTPECLENIISTQDDIRFYNKKENPNESFMTPLNKYTGILLANPPAEKSIEEINAYPKKK